MLRPAAAERQRPGCPWDNQAFVVETVASTMMAMVHARNHLAVNDGRLSLKQRSFEKLSVDDASMDGILAVNVLYFVEPLKSALAEAWRVLRPGRSLVIYVRDKSVMSRLQFDGRDTRQTFDKRDFTDCSAQALSGRVKSKFAACGFRSGFAEFWQMSPSRSVCHI
ncbi:class I SAM-dependent methyltransferase [Rhizobium sp. 2YAF20]|uniref:class I SAM-dependent methyltransferase n=1 Tax=Rhizobium sp. 2YAF20 TaxID=3233027 RepID=UPI003F9CD93B